HDIRELLTRAWKHEQRRTPMVSRKAVARVRNERTGRSAHPSLAHDPGDRVRDLPQSLTLQRRAGRRRRMWLYCCDDGAQCPGPVPLVLARVCTAARCSSGSTALPSSTSSSSSLASGERSVSIRCLASASRSITPAMLKESSPGLSGSSGSE